MEVAVIEPFDLLQVVGHMFAYPVVLDLVADGAGEKEEVSSLVDDVVGMYISSAICVVLYSRDWTLVYSTRCR